MSFESIMNIVGELYIQKNRKIFSFNLFSSFSTLSGKDLTRDLCYNYLIRRLQMLSIWTSILYFNPFPIHSSKLKKFADDNFKFDENDRKLSKQLANTVGKGEIAHYEQFLLFQQCFRKTCTADT